MAFLIENAKPLEQCDPTDLWRGELHLELLLLETLEAQLSTIEKQLDQIAKTDAQVKRVQTINGVGRVTAEAIVAYIDDPHRFKPARQVGSYAGLVPRQYQSARRAVTLHRQWVGDFTPLFVTDTVDLLTRCCLS